MGNSGSGTTAWTSGIAAALAMKSGSSDRATATPMTANLRSTVPPASLIAASKASEKPLPLATIRYCSAWAAVGPIANHAAASTATASRIAPVFVVRFISMFLGS